MKYLLYTEEERCVGSVERHAKSQEGQRIQNCRNVRDSNASIERP